jgi:hypothetical protein
MNNEARLMVKIEELLRSKHVGKKNAISSERISSILRIADGEANPVTRSIITRLIFEKHVPIGACTFGYFIIENEEEFQEYINDLYGRMEGIKKRIKSLTMGWTYA